MKMYDTKTIAEMLGVTQSTIRSMKARGKLPTPDMKLNGGYVWFERTLRDILKPAKKHNNPFECTVDKELPPVIDLFSGCGGMSLGFIKASFEVIAALDNWKPAIETYNFNFAHSASICDLSDYDQAVAVLQKIIDTRNSTPAIIGGPPCQDFSSAGKRKEGNRAGLTEVYARIVSRFQPPFFVMENVARSAKSKAYSQALSIFSDAGYSVESIILDASRCGVPQSRKRLITFGSKEPIFSQETQHLMIQNQSEQVLTVRDWFNTSLDTEFYYRHPRSYARRAIFSIDEPSPTVRGVNRPIPDGYTGHRGDAAPIEKARPLTTRERASIQTFPDNFEFVSSKTNNEQLIGNAVPVELAFYIATQIKTAYQSLVDVE